jgi:transcriptional regulator with XRE-family HTH domain
MENIMDTLQSKLRSVPASQWDAIAAESGVAKSLIRKIAYGDRLNPGVQKIQPLLHYFARNEQKQAT